MITRCKYCDGAGYIGGAEVLVKDPPDGIAPNVLTRRIQSVPDDAAAEGHYMAEFLLLYTPATYIDALYKGLQRGLPPLR